MPGQSLKYFTVSTIPHKEGQEKENLGSFLGKEVKIDVNLKGRELMLLEIRPQD